MKLVTTMKPILVFTAGAFGAAVGARMLAAAPAAPTPLRVAPLPHDLDTLRAQTGEANASAIGVAAWRPHVKACELIDDLCFAAGMPWSQVEVHGQRLTCGPVVQPGHGPCFHCYRKRWASHHPAPEREMVIAHAYERDASLGPPGFVGPLVEIAAAALWEDLLAPVTQAGRLRVVDVLTGGVLETAVLGVHACPRCGLPAAGPVGARFVNHLVPAIDAAWAGAHA